MIKMQRLQDFPAETNPFHHDHYHMGTAMGTNVMVMMPNHADQHCDYIIVINTATGERVIVHFGDGPGVTFDPDVIWK